MRVVKNLEVHAIPKLMTDLVNVEYCSIGKGSIYLLIYEVDKLAFFGYVLDTSKENNTR